mmetsp:Transcript_94592/g.148971  ORF Transcript_94592/g.148971 Transcript_94592/m.148971 type:complete len:249 (-) Transcript_94592:171-917(-)
MIQTNKYDSRSSLEPHAHILWLHLPDLRISKPHEINTFHRLESLHSSKLSTQRRHVLYRDLRLWSKILAYMLWLHVVRFESLDESEQVVSNFLIDSFNHCLLAHLFGRFRDATNCYCNTSFHPCSVWLPKSGRIFLLLFDLASNTQNVSASCTFVVFYNSLCAVQVFSFFKAINHDSYSVADSLLNALGSNTHAIAFIVKLHNVSPFLVIEALHYDLFPIQFRQRLQTMKENDIIGCKTQLHLRCVAF